MIKLKIVLFVLVLNFINAFSVNYYLSGSGNDSANGKTINSAWQSIKQLNKQVLKPGDSVLFCCNGVYHGEIEVNQSGTQNKNIVFSSYNKGTMPIITGAVSVNNWSLHKGQICSTKFNKKVYNLFNKHKTLTYARYPNNGWLRVDAGTGNNYKFIDYDLKQPKKFWTWAQVHFRIWDWEYCVSEVINFTDNAITIADSATNFFSRGMGYFIDNKFEALDTINEWYYDNNLSTLYLMPQNAVIEQNSIEACVCNSAVTLKQNVSYITFNNLQFIKYSNSAINAIGNNQAICIQNNKFENLMGTAVNIGLGSSLCKVYKNTFNNILGRGIVAIEPDSLIIENNLLTCIGLSAGYGHSGVNGMVGIAIVNIEEIKTENMHIATNNIVRQNVLDSIGYVGIRVDGSNNLTTQNIVSNTLLELCDGAAIYCWAKPGYYTYNNSITSNIVFNAKGNNYTTQHTGNPIAYGVYIDNNSYNINVSNNTIYNITGGGVIINSGSYNVTVNNNTVYSCGEGLAVAEWIYPNSTYGNIISNNIFFATKVQHRCISLSNWCIPNNSFLASYTNNKYYHFFDKYLMKEAYISTLGEEKIQKEYTFKAWQNQFVSDSTSIAYEYNCSLANNFLGSEIIVNSQNNFKNVVLVDSTTYNLKGEIITNIQLNPFSSQIVLKK